MPGLPLSLPEREEILLALIADRVVSWAELARRVGRHPTTMAREVAASGSRRAIARSSRSAARLTCRSAAAPECWCWRAFR